MIVGIDRDHRDPLLLKVGHDLRQVGHIPRRRTAEITRGEYENHAVVHGVFEIGMNFIQIVLTGKLDERDPAIAGDAHMRVDGPLQAGEEFGVGLEDVEGRQDVE